MMGRTLIGSLALTAMAACSGGGAGVQQTALRIFLDEEAAPSGVFPRFQPLRSAGIGPALDVNVPKFGVRGGFLREVTAGGIETWLGTDGVTLSFDRGVLHGTRGLGSGLLTSDVSQSASAVLAGRSGQVERIHTFLNSNNEAISRAYICQIENQGSETLRFDIGNVRTRKMVERCDNLDQSFTNTYWVDPSRGRILRSNQWTGEFAGEITINTVFNF